MKKIYNSLGWALLLSAVCCGGESRAQGTGYADPAMAADFCSRNSLLYSQFVKYYIVNNYTDSAQAVLQDWEGSCGNSEQVFRTKVLLSIENQSLDNAVLGQGFLDGLLLYKTLPATAGTDSLKANGRMDASGNLLVDTTFDDFTMQWAGYLLQQQTPGTDGYLLCTYYSQPSDKARLDLIRNEDYAATQLGKLNRDLLNYKKAQRYTTFGVLAGMWMPQGDLKTIGVHPELGLIGGWHFHRSELLLDGGIRFLKSAHTYQAQQYDQWYDTRTFVGYWLGANYGFDVFRHKGITMQLLGGAAFDGFMVLKPISDQDVPGVYANSYNFNFGLGVWKNLPGMTQCGLQFKYNIVDYTLGNKIMLKGNYFSLRLIFRGLIDHDNYYEKLQQLGE